MNNRKLATGLIASLALMASSQVFAHNPQQNVSQRDYSDFSLPANGQSNSSVLEYYGQPENRQSGANGVDMWDYGSFRVMFKDDAVTFASMW